MLQSRNRRSLESVRWLDRIAHFAGFPYRRKALLQVQRTSRRPGSPGAASTRPDPPLCVIAVLVFQATCNGWTSGLCWIFEVRSLPLGLDSPFNAGWGLGDWLPSFTMSTTWTFVMTISKLAKQQPVIHKVTIS